MEIKFFFVVRLLFYCCFGLLSPARTHHEPANLSWLIYFLLAAKVECESATAMRMRASLCETTKGQNPLSFASASGTVPVESTVSVYVNQSISASPNETEHSISTQCQINTKALRQRLSDFASQQSQCLNLRQTSPPSRSRASFVYLCSENRFHSAAFA